MAKRYTIYRINAAGTHMTSIKAGSLSEMRDHCDRHYSKRKSKGRVYWSDKAGNRYMIHSYRPIFVPSK